MIKCLCSPQKASGTKGEEYQGNSRKECKPPGGTPYSGLYGEVPPERGAFFQLAGY